MGATYLGILRLKTKIRKRGPNADPNKPLVALGEHHSLRNGDTMSWRMMRHSIKTKANTHHMPVFIGL